MSLLTLADGSTSTDYFQGDLFVVQRTFLFTKGSVVRLLGNPSESMPLFALVEGDCFFANAPGGEPGAFMGWENVKAHSRALPHRLKRVI